MRDFAAAGGFADPQDIATFQRSKLNWILRQQAPHSFLLSWYRDWIAMRKRHACLRNCRKSMVRTKDDAGGRWLVAEHRDISGSRALLVCNFSEGLREVPLSFQNVDWSLCLWSRAARYGTPAPEPPAHIRGNEPRTLELPGQSAALYIGLIWPKDTAGEQPCD